MIHCMNVTKSTFHHINLWALISTFFQMIWSFCFILQRVLNIKSLDLSLATATRFLNLLSDQWFCLITQLTLEPCKSSRVHGRRLWVWLDFVFASALSSTLKHWAPLRDCGERKQVVPLMRWTTRLLGTELHLHVTDDPTKAANK